MLLTLTLTLKLGSADAQAAPSDVIVIRAAQLIDGTGAPPVHPAMIRVEGDRIAEVARSVRIPDGARVIDLGDATLLPGLIDLHTHLTSDERVHWEDALVKSTPPRDALWGARNARVTLLAGFTSVRDMGPSWPYVDVELRRAIDDGAVPGPRMMVAGNYVSSTGGAGDARQYSIYVDTPLVRNLADGPEEVTKAVRTNLKKWRRLHQDTCHRSGALKGHCTGRAAVLGRGDPGGGRRGAPLGQMGCCARARC